MTGAMFGYEGVESDLMGIDLTAHLPDHPQASAAYLVALRHALEPHDDFWRTVMMQSVEQPELLSELLPQGIRAGLHALVSSSHGAGPREKMDRYAAEFLSTRPDIVKFLPKPTYDVAQTAIGFALCHFTSRRDLPLLSMLLYRAFREPGEIVAAYSRAGATRPQGAWLTAHQLNLIEAQDRAGDVSE